MDIVTLKSTIEWFTKHPNEINALVYAIKKGSYNAVKLDIDSTALLLLKDTFLEQLREQIIDEEDLSLLDYSAADERRNVIYKFDVDIPEELLSFKTISTSEDVPSFDFTVDSIKDIRALLIHIGNNKNQLILYKTHAPVNTFDRKKIFLINKTNRLTLIEDDFLRISSGFQLLYTAGTLFILNIKVAEKLFGFNEVVFKEAHLALPSIKQLAVIANPEILDEVIQDIRYARKLIKISENSPVIQNNVAADQIIEFCKKHPHLQKVFKFNANGDKLILKSKKSKDEFLKILRDDWLNSELTKQEYESRAKDPVIIE